MGHARPSCVLLVTYSSLLSGSGRSCGDCQRRDALGGTKASRGSTRAALAVSSRCIRTQTTPNLHTEATAPHQRPATCFECYRGLSNAADDRKLRRQPGQKFLLAVADNKSGPGVFVAEAGEAGICFQQVSVCWSVARS